MGCVRELWQLFMEKHVSSVSPDPVNVGITFMYTEGWVQRQAAEEVRGWVYQKAGTQAGKQAVNTQVDRFTDRSITYELTGSKKSAC